VIVESLVVTPLLIIVCSMSFYAFRMHHEKLALMRRVREPLVASAISGCNRGGSASPPPSVPGADLSIIPDTLPGGPNQAILDRPLRTTSESAQRTVDGDANAGTGAQTMRMRSSMMCNEPIEDGRLAQMRRVAAENFP
jgi:hypothetical protein